MTEKQPNLDSLFLSALEIESGELRAKFLDQSCGENGELREQVNQLLLSHEQAGSFLEKPALELEATILPENSRDNLAESLEAGLAASFGKEEAVVIGRSDHSVLKTLGQTIDLPQVALRDSIEEGDDSIVQPNSAEMPTTNSDSRYQLQGEIARGGMGAIIKGRDTDLGRDLAIKVLLDDHKDKPEVVQRFVEEAQIGGQLQHPGIAPIYELGQFADKRPFFAMKLVKGKTLSAILSEREDANAERGKLLGIFEQMCQTMAYAHSRGVIHRDLKPANIMVGAFGEVQVMDWGLAKVLPVGGVADEKKAHTKHKDVSVIQTLRSVGSDAPGTFGTQGSETQMGSVMGTPAYMPPEQALGEIDNLDERADVFGLGAILCEILTGQPPYVGTDGNSIYRQAARGKLGECFERLDACEADAELIALTKHCLELEPEDRPRDAGVLAEQVAGYLESVENKLRETEREKADAQIRTEELRRRNKLAITAGTAIVAVLVIGISVSVWQAVRATNAETLARNEAVRATNAETLARDEAVRATTAEGEAKVEAARALEAEALAKAEATRATAAEKKTAETLVEVAAERDAKELARKEAEDISKFLGEVFQSPDPARDGRTITVAETLDTAAKNLETDLADQPAQRAKLQDTLGSTYRALGLYQQAISLREQVRDYYLATLGPEHPSTLHAMNELAVSYSDAGRQDEALNMREEVLKLARKVLGPEHPNTLMAMNNLAGSYNDASRQDEALEMQEEALKLNRKVLGPEHPGTLTVMNNLALSYGSAGRQDEALNMQEELLKLSRKVLDPEHLITLITMKNLANSYNKLGFQLEPKGRTEEAINAWRKTLELNPQIKSNAPFYLGVLLEGSKKPDEAFTAYLTAIRNGRMRQQAIEKSLNIIKDPKRLAACMQTLKSKSELAEAAFTVIASTGRTMEALPLLAEFSVGKPEDTELAMKVAALQAWYSKDAEYLATCEHMLKWAGESTKSEEFERIAKLTCLRPISDATMQETTLALAQRAIEIGPENKEVLPWYQLALGMAEFRSGNYTEADTALNTAAETAPDSKRERIEGISNFYHTMSLFQQGKPDEARTLFTESEANMKPLPADEKNPLADNANHDDLILWLAYKEAKALFAETGTNDE